MLLNFAFLNLTDAHAEMFAALVAGTKQGPRALEMDEARKDLKCYVRVF